MFQETRPVVGGIVASMPTKSDHMPMTVIVSSWARCTGDGVLTAPALPSGELLWPSGKNSKWPSRIPGIKLASCFILHKVQISPPLIPKGGDFTAKGFLSSCQTKRTHPKIHQYPILPGMGSRPSLFVHIFQCAIPPWNTVHRNHGYGKL